MGHIFFKCRQTWFVWAIIFGLFQPLLVNATETTDQPKQIVIGFAPGDNPKNLQENSLNFAQLLQSKLKTPISILISKDYSSLVEAMKSKKVDFAFFSSMSFVFAEKEAGAKVLLKRVYESPFYYSTILVRKDSKINSIEQLKGKSFAFVDEKSTSGYLYPQVLFKQKGLDPKTFFSSIQYSGSHAASSESLRDKKVDAIAVFSNDAKNKLTAFNKYIEDKGRPQVRSVWVSSPIPNDPFCVRQDFYEQFPRTAHDLMFTIIDLLDDKENGKKFRQSIGNAGMMLATSQQYDPVRDMVRELDLKIK